FRNISRRGNSFNQLGLIHSSPLDCFKKMALNGMAIDRYNDQNIAGFYSNALKHLSSNHAARYPPQKSCGKIIKYN
ncbi:MAG: hypothetical protein ACTH2G_05160, partial [Halomonadaceae bacterium]